MSTLAEVMTEVKTILKNDATLSAYVKNVLLGMRENVQKDHMPIIFIEPDRYEEQDIHYTKVDCFLTIGIIGLTYAYEKDLQIIGDTNYKGVLDFENDVKKAFGSYPTLNGKAIKFSFPVTAYEIVDYPARGIRVDMLIHFRQDLTTRT